jgi:hypothetical protein
MTPKNLRVAWRYTIMQDKAKFRPFHPTHKSSAEMFRLWTHDRSFHSSSCLSSRQEPLRWHRDASVAKNTAISTVYDKIIYAIQMHRFSIHLHHFLRYQFLTLTIRWHPSHVRALRSRTERDDGTDHHEPHEQKNSWWGSLIVANTTNHEPSTSIFFSHFSYACVVQRLLRRRKCQA